jgi:small-conductance mechanosensitive channel
MKEPTIVEQLETMTAQAAASSELVTGLQANLDEATAANAELTASVESLTDQASSLTADNAAFAETITGLTAAQTELQATIATQATALSHPAYLDAVNGAAPASQQGGEGDNVSASEQYKKISDPNEKAKFYRENKALIHAGK